jgi:type II secretory pathway pseudopilin PulG
MHGRLQRQRHVSRRSSRGSAGQGFTIVEVMIVLIVTSALFVSAAVLISGRQSQTAFDQAIRQIQAQIQQVMDEVSNGYFPDSNFSCTAGPSGPVLTTVPSGGQGTNSGCIFVGKAIQFKVANSDPEQYVIHTLAGLQKGPTGQEATGLIQSLPKSVTRTTSDSSLPDITIPNTLDSGLTVSGMWYDVGSGKVNVGIVAFVITLPGISNGALKPGAPFVQAIPVVGSALNTSVAQGADALNGSNFNDPANSPRDPLNGTSICFASGGTNQSGLITIGGNGRPLDVSLKIISGNPTCS